MSVAELAAEDSRAVGLQLQIETPENVVLGYELAGPAIRCAAYLIDSAIRGGIVLVVLMILGCMGALADVEGFTQGAFLVLMFVMEWGYFAFCEGLFKGRTIGKRALGLRVISKRGQPVSFQAAMLRNLVRAADAVPLYGPAFLTMMFSRDLERLGDLVARTVVVRERSVRVPRDPLILERIQPLPRDEINRFNPDTRLLAVIDDFLSRRSVMSHERGHAIAGVLADQLAERLDYRGDESLVETYPMAFLARVYVTFSRSEDSPPGDDVETDDDDSDYFERRPFDDELDDDELDSERRRRQRRRRRRQRRLD